MGLGGRARRPLLKPLRGPQAHRHSGRPPHCPGGLAGQWQGPGQSSTAWEPGELAQPACGREALLACRAETWRLGEGSGCKVGLVPIPAWCWGHTVHPSSASSRGPSPSKHCPRCLPRRGYPWVQALEPCPPGPSPFTDSAGTAASPPPARCPRAAQLACLLPLAPMHRAEGCARTPSPGQRAQRLDTRPPGPGELLGEMSPGADRTQGHSSLEPTLHQLRPDSCPGLLQ